jgi:hypothetical protein
MTTTGGGGDGAKAPFYIPRPPDDPASFIGQESVAPRYEDISEDGRLRLEGIWHPTGRLLWSGHDLGRTLFQWGRDHGLRTVLSRVVLQAANLPVAPRIPMRTELRYRFEHARHESGEVSRLFFTTWLGTEAPVPDRLGGFARVEGEPRTVARAYGQRTFVRLDAPAGERKVARLPGFEGDGVPPERGEWVEPSSLLLLPEGAEPLEERPRRSSVRIVFGLSHTDANQHVNFMAYPRYLEQAALGHLHDLGLSSRLMARRVELAYRRPSFAGEVIHVALRAFRREGDVGVVAAFVDGGDGPDVRGDFSAFGRPRCVARMLLSP